MISQFEVFVPNGIVFAHTDSLRITWNADEIVSRILCLLQLSTDETKQFRVASNALKRKPNFIIEKRNSFKNIDHLNNKHSLAIFSIHFEFKMFIFNPFF